MSENLFDFVSYMEQKPPRLYPSAPLENNDLKHRLDKKI